MAYMQLDATGINFIKVNEGLPRNRNGLCTAYQDSTGIWTIGYGHTQGVYQGETITVAQANAWFSSDINGKYGKCVNMSIKRPMNQNQFDAMVDFCYNIGTAEYDGFPSSQVCKLFNEGNIKGASSAFMGWLKPASLLGRREKEIKLFNTPVSTAQKNSTPSTNNNNTNAINDAKKKSNAVTGNAKIKANQQAIQNAKVKALKLSEALQKAKETKNPIAIKKAQNDINKSKVVTPTKPIQAKVLQGGMGIIGVIATAIILKNGYDL